MILDEAGDAVTCVSVARGMGEARIVTSSVDGKVCASCRLFGVDYIRIPPPRLIAAHYYLDAILPSRFFSRFRVPSHYFDVITIFCFPVAHPTSDRSAPTNYDHLREKDENVRSAHRPPGHGGCLPSHNILLG